MRMHPALIFIFIFISSLYGYDLKIYIYIFSLLLLFFFLRKEISEPNLFKLIIIAVAVSTFLSYTLFFVEFISDYVSIESIDAVASNITLCIYIIIYISLIYLYLDKNHIYDLERPCGYALLLHNIIFFVGFFSLVIGDFSIDFYHLFNSDESRYLNYISDSIFTKYRATGLFIEPSTYCSIMTCLLCIYMASTNIKRKKINIVIITILSMLISFSSAAYILSLFVLLSLLSAHENKKAMLFFMVVFVVLSFPILYLVSSEVLLKFSSSSESRSLLLQYLYFYRDSWALYFGYGPLGVEQFLYTSSIDGTRIFSSLNDAGLVNYFVVHFGLFGLIIPIVCIYKVIRRMDLVFLMLALFLTKLTYTFPLVIIGLFCLIFSANQEKYECEKL